MKIQLILLFLVLLSSSIIAMPSPPHNFYGTVTVNGNSAQDGLLIEGQINGKNASATTTTDGKFTLTVQDPYGDRTGKRVYFYIEGIDTNQSAIFTDALLSSKTMINLSVDGVVFCGDSICNGGETYSTCSADCNPPAQVPAANNPGGSSGGGSSGGAAALFMNKADACTPDWQCTNWLECIGGKQKRVCTDKNKCDGEAGKPIETRDCIIPDEMKSEAQDDGTNNLVENTVDEPEEAPKMSGLAAITGRVIAGLQGQSVLIGLIVIVVIIAAGILVYVKVLR